ncbi:MAG TPA: IS200/IS605 family transposase [Puia sp.]|nr:IS200/IS605 family transposase [Puia sp.]
MNGPSVYLFVHVICTVQGREKLLAKPVRKVLFAHMQKEGEGKGLQILAANGVEDHMHLLIQLMPAQNLAQVVRSIKASSSDWMNENKLLATAFEWEERYYALSVSPSSVKQVKDFIEKQEEHHKAKNLDAELEAFVRLKEQI